MLQVDIQLNQPYGANSEFGLKARFDLFPGQCMGVMGASGAGKTTLLHAIAGLLTPAFGRIGCDEQVWFDAKQAIQVPSWQRQVGLVFQDGRLFPHMTVEQNLRYGMPKSEGSITLLDVAGVLEIAALLKRKPGQLSGGERQRVAIGRALLRQPSVLMMDEPLNGLDHHLKQQMLSYIQQVSASFGLPTIYVSHVREEVVEIANEIWVLAQGVLRQPDESACH